jgi:type IV pilus assembly protein PilC
MSKFTYTAKNPQGEVLRDVIEADSRPAALAVLRAKDLTVVALNEIADTGTPSAGGKGTAPAAWKAPLFQKKNGNDDLTVTKKKWLTPRKVKLKDMAVFCRQLAISVNAGLALREALEGIFEDMETSPLRPVLDNVIKQLHDGVPFSKAIGSHPTVFSAVFIGLVRAAEEAGSLGVTLNQLANYLESGDKLVRKIKTLLAYPAFVAVFFVIISGIMAFGIIPRFEEIFSDLGGDLPAITTAVFGLNRFIIRNFPWIVLIIAALVALFVYYKRTDTGKLRIASFSLKLPLAGDCLKKYVVARMCRCLAIMLASGVPVATALQIVSRIGNNAAIEAAIMEARTRIISGFGIAGSLAQTGIFPALLIRMLGVGEAAGKMPDVLDSVADSYEDQVESTITAATALLEPIIITVFGGLVLLLVISIYLPVFTVSMNIR